MDEPHRSSHVPALAQPQPLPVSTPAVIIAGTILWAVALVVTLVVPELRTGDRSWWPWACVTGIGLGAFGYAYVQRGRGNAADH